MYCTKSHVLRQQASLNLQLGLQLQLFLDLIFQNSPQDLAAGWLGYDVNKLDSAPQLLMRRRQLWNEVVEATWNKNTVKRLTVWAAQDSNLPWSRVSVWRWRVAPLSGRYTPGAVRQPRCLAHQRRRSQQPAGDPATDPPAPPAPPSDAIKRHVHCMSAYTEHTARANSVKV